MPAPNPDAGVVQSIAEGSITYLSRINNARYYGAPMNDRETERPDGTGLVSGLVFGVALWLLVAVVWLWLTQFGWVS